VSYTRATAAAAAAAAAANSDARCDACSWFIECSRDDAESMLLKHRRDGNVLMRPSSDRQYALTVRTTGSSATSVLIHSTIYAYNNMLCRRVFFESTTTTSILTAFST